MSVKLKSPAKTRRYAAATDQDLIEACLGGDQEAWAFLVDKYKKLVYSVPLKYRLAPEDAADIFQAVWIELFSQMGKLRSPNALRSWLITVAGHKCYEWKRRRSAQGEEMQEGVDVPDQRELPLAWRLQLERQQMLREAIVLLPERCRTIVQLLFFANPPLPYNELARRLNLAEGSIGFIRGRCLKRLRRLLEEMGFQA